MAGTGTTNDSSQGYHSISTSPTITTVENINKENIRTPLSFKNPLFNNQTIKRIDNIHSDSSDGDDHDRIDLNHKQTHSSKALYFVNSLCIESLTNSLPPSSPKSLVHSTSRQSLQQPLFILNNSYMTRSTQSLAASSSSTTTHIHTPIITNSSSTYYDYFQINGKLTKTQSILSSQQGPPKMGIKALNLTSSSNKVKHI